MVQSLRKKELGWDHDTGWRGCHSIDSALPDMGSGHMSKAFEASANSRIYIGLSLWSQAYISIYHMSQHSVLDQYLVLPKAPT